MNIQFAKLISKKFKVSLKQASQIVEMIQSDPEINFGNLTFKQLIEEARMHIIAIKFKKGKPLEQIHKELKQLFEVE
jgi:hypothetical protein